jgi:hypothetical protein
MNQTQHIRFTNTAYKIAILRRKLEDFTSVLDLPVLITKKQMSHQIDDPIECV